MVPDESAISPARRAGSSILDRERAVAALAERQYGVVSRAQLLELGVGPSSIGRRLAHRRLHRLHNGVYALGHRTLTREARWLAAVLAGGPGAVLSHRSAATLWGILPVPGRRPEVTVGAGRHGGSDVDVHRCALERDERAAVDRIPVTTVSRTLLDLAAVVAPDHLERALREAEARHLGDATSLRGLLARYPRRRGTATLRRILAADHVGDGITRSVLEDRFLALVDKAALPRPKLNHHVDAAGRLLECDCVWRPQRLVVELDGHATHGRRTAFESDRARDRALAAAGWRVVRVTWRQLLGEAPALTADLRCLLG